MPVANWYIAAATIRSPTIGQPEPDADEAAATPFGLCVLSDDHGDGNESAQDIGPVGHDEVRHVDDGLGDAGQFCAHVLEHLREGRHDQPQHGGDGDHGDTHEDDRVHQRAHHLAARLP